MTRGRRAAVASLSLILGGLLGFFVLGGGGTNDPRLPATVSEPSPLILPLASGSTDDDLPVAALADPIAPRSEPQVVAVTPVSEPVPHAAEGDTTVSPAVLEFPDGGTATVVDYLFGTETAADLRFIDPCAGEAPGAGLVEGCDGVAGTILGYSAPGPFRITRVTTASLPGVDPAYDLCRLHYGAPGPGEINLAIYSTQPGDFTVSGWAAWAATNPQPGGTATGTTAMTRFGPIVTTTSTSQTVAWQAEMGSPRPNPGVVTCRRISDVGPGGSRLHVRVEGVSLVGAAARGEFDLTYVPPLRTPPISVTGSGNLMVRALIPVRDEHTPSLAIFPDPTASGSPGDQSQVDERCARGEPGTITSTEVSRLPIAFISPPALFGWDPAWTEFVFFEARLPSAGSYIACASRRVGGVLTEWSGFSIVTPAVPVVHVDVVAVNGNVPLTSFASGEVLAIWSGASPEDRARGIDSRRLCTLTDLSPRRDACTFNRSAVTDSLIAVDVRVGETARPVHTSIPDIGCTATPWSCPDRTDHFRIPVVGDVGTVDVTFRQVMPPWPVGLRGAVDGRQWAIQPTGAQVSTAVGSVLPPGPPVLTSSAVAPGSGDGPRLAVTLAASAPVHVLVTVEALGSNECGAPDVGSHFGPYQGGASLSLNLPVACAGARYSLKVEIEDDEGRQSVYSDVEPGAAGPALVGVSSTRTTQARVQASLASLPGSRPVHLASVSIVIDGRQVWALPPDPGTTTRRCVAADSFGMTAPAVFQAADTFQLRIEVEYVPYTNCASGAGRGTALRRVFTMTFPSRLTFSLNPVGVSESVTGPRIDATVSRW